MPKTAKVEVDSTGHVLPVEPSTKIPAVSAILTWPTAEEENSLSLAEISLAEDWLRPEEDAAWAHLQSDK